MSSFEELAAQGAELRVAAMSAAAEAVTSELKEENLVAWAAELAAILAYQDVFHEQLMGLLMTRMDQKLALQFEAQCCEIADTVADKLRDGLAAELLGEEAKETIQ